MYENKTGLQKGDQLSPILFNLALQKVTQSIKMVPSGIKIGKEQFNISAYARGNCINWEKWNRNKKKIVKIENIARKFELQINEEKTK